MDFDVSRAIPVNKSGNRQPVFDLSRAVPVAKQEKLPPLGLKETGDIVAKNLKETPGRMLNRIGETMQVIRWPYWRFIEHPVSTIVNETIQEPEGKTIGGTLSRAAQAYVPFRKIPKEEYGTYGKVWNTYYKQVLGKDAPGWYLAMASYGSAMAVEPPIIKAGVVAAENTLTRVATAEEASAIKTHFEPIKSALEKGGVKTKDLHPEGNIIKLDEQNEVFINKYLTAVLRGEEIRVPRWAKIKPVTAVKVVDPLATKGIVPSEPAPVVLPTTGPEIALKSQAVSSAVDIPDFKNTNEAIDFGIKNKDNAELIKKMEEKRAELSAAHKELMAKENLSDEELQAGMDSSVKNQFIRESIEAAKGIIKKPKDLGNFDYPALPDVFFQQNKQMPGMKDIVLGDKVVGKFGYEPAESEAADFDIEINKDVRTKGIATSVIQKIFDSGITKISGVIGGEKPLVARKWWLNRGAKVSGNNMVLYQEDFKPGPSAETKAELDKPKVISEKISASEVENMLERFYSQNKEMWREYEVMSWRDFLKRDIETLDMELSSDYETMNRYMKRFDDYDNVSPGDVVKLYKEGKLAWAIEKTKKTGKEIKIEDLPSAAREDFWSPQTKKLVDPKKVMEFAEQRLTKTNKDSILQARKDLFLAYNTDPKLNEKLGISKTELNKKIKGFSNYPVKAKEIEQRVNANIPDAYKWVGIENLAWINRQSIEPNVLDKFVKSIKIGDGGRGFWTDKGDYLRRYVINTFLGIDTKLVFDDLSFVIHSLEKAMGLFEPSKILITINDLNPNTVSHEIGHYLDYKFGRELGMRNALTEVFDSVNIKLIQEEHGLSDEHIAWAKKFYDYVMEVSERSDISSTYNQRRTEVFARLVARFVEWANTEAGVKTFNESRYYSDKFQTGDYYQLIRLLQEKAYIDEKYGIKPLVGSSVENVEKMLPPEEQFGNISPKVIKKLQNKLEELKTEKEKKDLIKESLSEIDRLRKELKGTIRRYSEGFLKEELADIPKYYITTKGGSNPDEVMQTLRDKYGMQFDNESDLVSYLKNLDSTKSSLESQLEELKPGMVTMQEKTLAKKELKAAESAAKEAQRQMEKVLESEEKQAKKDVKKAFKEGKAAEAELRKKRYFGSEITPEQRRELYVVALKKGVIYVDYSGKEHDKLQGLIRFYKGASFDQLQKYITSLSGNPENPAKLFKLYGNIDKDAAALQIINQERADWRDINATEVYTLDPVRTIEKVTKHNIWENNVLANNTFNVIDAADEAMFDRKVKELHELDVARQKVASGSKESAEIMRKFEAGEPLTDKEQKIVDFLRAKYDMLIAEANIMREALGKRPIPYRQDYMTHIVESNLLRDFFQGNEAGMEKISQEQMDAIRRGDYTRGNMPFNQFALKRLGSKTKYDALGNYIRYLNTILREVYMTPAISHSRKFIEYALDKQPNAFKSMDRMLNDLKGKVSIVDQNLIGHIAGSMPIKWLRSHIARSALIGNINFWVMNVSNIFTSVGELGNYTNIGMAKFLGSKEWRTFAFENSRMLKGRAIDPDFVNQPVHTKLEELVAGVTNLIEYNNVGSTFVGAYIRAVEELGYGKEQAIEYADAVARRTQVGYKPYEVNAWMRSNSGKLMSQFQTWSYNAMNYILYDIGAADIPGDFASMFTKDKQAKMRWGAFLTLAVTTMMLDALYKKLGLREPYQPTSLIPSIAGMNVGKYSDIGPARIAKDVVSSFTAKKAETREKARMRAVGSVVPGGAQAVRLLQGRVFPINKGEKKIKIGD